MKIFISYRRRQHRIMILLHANVNKWRFLAHSLHKRKKLAKKERKTVKEEEKREKEKSS